MKIVFIFSLVLLSCSIKAQRGGDDPVVMTVAEKPIYLSEFVFMAHKNGEVDLSDEKSLKEYVELFKDFKLKVADAKASKIDESETFKKELEEYLSELTASYLHDKKGEEAAMRLEYDRMAEALEVEHIYFTLPSKALIKDTLAVYKEAMGIYDLIRKGNSLAEVGKRLQAEHAKDKHVGYEYLSCMRPMKTMKAFENTSYTTPTGSVSMPVRTALGYHLIRVISRKPNLGRIRVAQIFFSIPKDSMAEKEESARIKAESVYEMAKNGADFAELAKKYSEDPSTRTNGGNLPLLGFGEMIESFEEAAFALSAPGDISKPVRTELGYHIIKLLEKKDRASFEETEPTLSRKMGQGEHNFELYKAFDERMKKEYGFVLYPKAYSELEALCDECFPTDSSFYEKAKKMKKTLMHLNNMDFTQKEFVDYLVRCPYSTKTYGGDFMREVFDLYVRDIVTAAERKNISTKYPEYTHLAQEYRDGMLLFEVSNKNIWQKPISEQAELEKEWIKKLEKEYPVTINWKLLKKLKK